MGLLTAWPGDRTVSRPGSNPATVTSLRNFGNSVYPALPVSFGGQFYDLYPASVTPGRILDGQFCVRSMLMKDSAEQLCRRPVGQRGDK